MGLHKVKSRVTEKEYQAFHFQGPNDFDALEKFVGGDSEFRNGRVIVAGPQGRITVELDGWVIKFSDTKYSAAGSFATHQTFEVLP